MSIAVIGLSHKTAEINFRELLAIPEHRLESALLAFRTHFPTQEVLIISTCNRLEIYTTLLDQQHLILWLSAFYALSVEILKPYLYYCEHEAALKHAIKVTAGLDSMVLGEPQIFGQVKNAWNIANKNDLIGPHLDCAFQHIFSAAKAVRTETQIGHCPVSIAYYATRMATEALHHPTAQQQVIIIGAGSTGSLLAQHMQALGYQKISIMNRSFERAKALATAFHLTARPFEELPKALETADLVMSATDSESYILTYDMVNTALAQRRKTTPIFFVDIANPRDIDPRIATLPQAFLYNLDDLSERIAHNFQKRQEAAQHAESVIERCLIQYDLLLKTRLSVAAIKNIRGKAESLKEQELVDSLKLLEQGRPAEEVLLRLANRLTQKWLHHPCVNLRNASINGEHHLLDAALALFKEQDETEQRL